MNIALSSELIDMRDRDVAMRARLLHENRLYDDYAEEMQQIHIANACRLNELVTQYGWPTMSLVGLEGCRAAWLVAQHSICTPDLQREFLCLLTEAAKTGGVPDLQVAFLTDRVRACERKPQIYGTVFDWNENGELSCDVEDLANLDARRRQVGLPAFAVDLASHRKDVAAEGGNPPRDFEQAKRRRLEWSKRVGWID
jgi:hypothetical protein